MSITPSPKNHTDSPARRKVTLKSNPAAYLDHFIDTVDIDAGKIDKADDWASKVATALTKGGLLLSPVLQRLRQRGAKASQVTLFGLKVCRWLRRWEDFTDLANARRLVRYEGRDLRYCGSEGWLVWDGRRWRRDSTDEVIRRAKRTIDALKEEGATLRSLARKAKDDALKDHIAGLSGFMDSSRFEKIEARHRIENMVKLAASEPEVAVDPADLDADPMVLNVLNGTIDLRTAQLRPHRRDDLITKLVTAEYDPNATSQRWDQFLAQVTGGDPEYIGYLQRVGGYTLTGRTDHEELFFVFGPGATGKSTIMDAFKAALGEYARTANFETFAKRPASSSGPSEDLARLKGARFVASIEVDDGKQLAEAVIKSTTGGDPVTARHLYQNSQEFVPQYKLFLVANHAPGVDATDDAMWRRIRVLPFVNVVPAAQRDPDLKAALKDPNRLLPAVLAWMVRGCLEWQRVGLNQPQAVLQATERYRQDANPLAD